MPLEFIGGPRPVNATILRRGPQGLPGASGDQVSFASRALAITQTIAGGATFLRTSGYAAVGDGGAALYKKAASEPGHPGKFQSADGAWWGLVERYPSIEMFGGNRANLFEYRAEVLPPIVLFGTGDSRMRCGNGFLDAAGATAVDPYCKFWKNSTSSWVDGTLGSEPFIGSKNHLLREAANFIRRTEGRSVYCIILGVDSSTIFSWLDPDASHGVGNASNNWDTAADMLDDALASADLAAWSVGGLTKVNVVSLLTNNGAAELAEAAGYVKNYVTQLREEFGEDFGVCWLENQETANLNISNQNQTIRHLAVTRQIPDFTSVSSVGVETVQSSPGVYEGVHESSPGFVEFAPRIWSSYNSRNAYAAAQDFRPIPYRTIPASTTDLDPHVLPCNLRKSKWENRTTADAYIEADPTRWQDEDELIIRSRSSGGGGVFLKTDAGQVEYRERPGFFDVVEYIPAGCTAHYYRTTVSGVPSWATDEYNQGASPFFIYIGNGVSETGLSLGDDLTHWTVKQQKGMPLTSGKATILRPGIYEIKLYTTITTVSRLYVIPSGGSKTPFFNGHLSMEWPLAIGDQLGADAGANGSDIDWNAGRNFFSARWVR